MASESTSENVDKEVEKVPESPGRTTSKSKRSSAFSRLNPTKIFSKKKSGKDDVDEEEVSQVISNMTHESLIENENEESMQSSTETEKHHNWGERFMHKIEKTKDALKEEVKEGVEKAKDTIETTMKEFKDRVHKDKSGKEATAHKNSSSSSSSSEDEKEELPQQKETNEDTPSKEELDESSNTLQEVIKDDHVNTNQSSSIDQLEEPHNDENKKEEEEEEKEKKYKKEDDCMSSLAQGLQKICAPWSSKKED